MTRINAGQLRRAINAPFMENAGPFRGIYERGGVGWRLSGRMHHRPRQRRRGPLYGTSERSLASTASDIIPWFVFTLAQGIGLPSIVQMADHLCTPKLHIEPAPGSAADPYRSQAARGAAGSSRVTLGDLAGLPLLMNAPCPHCEQISTRGSDAAVAAPICPQLGQTIRVSMSVTTAAAGAAARASTLRQQLRQLGDVDSDPPGLVAGEEL